MIFAMSCISLLGSVVWGHHMYTVGLWLTREFRKFFISFLLSSVYISLLFFSFISLLSVGYLSFPEILSGVNFYLHFTSPKLCCQRLILIIFHGFDPVIIFSLGSCHQLIGYLFIIWDLSKLIFHVFGSLLTGLFLMRLVPCHHFSFVFFFLSLVIDGYLLIPYPSNPEF